MAACFPQAARSDCRRLASVWACPSDPLKLCLSAAQRLSDQELVNWFGSQNLRLSSGIAFHNDCQMACRGSNLDSTGNLNSAAWPMGYRDFICSETPEESSINCVDFEFFVERQNWGQLWVNDTNPHPPDCAEGLTHIILVFKLLCFYRVEQLSLLVLTLPQHYALALDVARYNYLCQFFLSLYTRRWEHNSSASGAKFHIKYF